MTDDFAASVDQAIAAEQTDVAKDKLAGLQGTAVERKIAALEAPMAPQMSDQYRSSVLETVKGGYLCLGAGVRFLDEDAGRVLANAGTVFAEPTAALVIGWAQGRWEKWFAGGALALGMFQAWINLKAQRVKEEAEKKALLKRQSGGGVDLQAAATAPKPSSDTVIFRLPEDPK